jgi:hypothetical protein
MKVAGLLSQILSRYCIRPYRQSVLVGVNVWHDTHPYGQDGSMPFDDAITTYNRRLFDFLHNVNHSNQSHISILSYLMLCQVLAHIPSARVL